MHWMKWAMTVSKWHKQVVFLNQFEEKISESPPVDFV